MIEGVIESDVCLLPMITPTSRTFLRIYRHYREGFLPEPGGLLNQRNRVIEAIEILDDQIGKMREADARAREDARRN